METHPSKVGKRRTKTLINGDGLLDFLTEFVPSYMQTLEFRVAVGNAHEY